MPIVPPVYIRQNGRIFTLYHVVSLCFNFGTKIVIMYKYDKNKREK